MFEEKDDNAVEEKELSLKDQFDKAEEEEKEDASEDSSTQKEDSQEEEKDDETSTLEKLDDDEDFQEAKKELETEMGGKDLTYNQTKKFRKTYWQAKENERLLQAKQEELETLQNKELSDNEVLGEGVKRGLFEQDKEPVQKKDEFDLDALKAKATPEQREWLDIIEKVSARDKKVLQSKLDDYESRFGDLTDAQQAKEVSSEEVVLRKEAKDTYGLDYDTDIRPEMIKLASEKRKSIPEHVSMLEAGWTPRNLMNQVIAGKSLELSEKKLVKKKKKEKEDKKKANIETDQTQGGLEEGNDDDKTFNQILNEELAKEGLNKFE